MFKDLRNKDDNQKKMTAIVLSTVITLIIVGCSIVYNIYFVKKENSNLSFSQLKKVESLKESFNKFGKVVDTIKSDGVALIEQSSSTELINTDVGTSTEETLI